MPTDTPSAGFGLFQASPPAGFRAQAAGGFNALGAGGQFQAYCTFVVASSYFASSTPQAQFLWGNLNANTGFGFALAANADGAAVIRASMGDGSAVTALDVVVSGTALAMRLVHASMFYAEGVLSLFVNGQAIQRATVGQKAVSVKAPTIGFTPATSPADAAADCYVMSAGYAYYAFTQAQSYAAAGNAYLAQRAIAGAGGQLWPDLGVPWVHQYSARDGLAANVGASIVRVPTGAYLGPSSTTSYPVARATIPDIGNATPQNATLVAPIIAAPVALAALVDASAPIVRGFKNLDWYQGGVYAAWVPPGDLFIPTYTTAERDAITPVGPMLIINSTVDAPQIWFGGTWYTIVVGV